jgi:hypothetical protein
VSLLSGDSMGCNRFAIGAAGLENPAQPSAEVRLPRIGGNRGFAGQKGWNDVNRTEVSSRGLLQQQGSYS